MGSASAVAERLKQAAFSPSFLSPPLPDDNPADKIGSRPATVPRRARLKLTEL